MVSRASAGSRPIATSTWEGVTAPLAQADPAEQATPCRSSSSSRSSARRPGNRTDNSPGSPAPAGRVAVDLQVGGEGAEGGEEAGTEGGQGGGGAGLAFGQGGGGGGAEAGEGGRREGAGAQAPLLAAAVDERAQAGPGPHDQGADAGGAAKLVGGQGQQVDAVAGQVDPGQPGRLHGVAEQDRARGVGRLGHGRDRLAGPDLVVGRHHRDQGGPPRPEQAGQPVRVDPAETVDRGQVDRGPGVGLGPGGGVEHGVVLDGRADQVPALRRPGEHGALDGQVVGLGAAGGEHDLGRVGADQRGDLLTGGLHRGPRGPPLAVLAGRVGGRALQQRQHRRQSLSPQRGAGRVVEVRHGSS